MECWNHGECREGMEPQGTDQGRAVMQNGKAASLHRWMVGIISTAMGFILVTAALMKATDMGLFIRQISDYGLVTQPILVALGAWGMIAFQVTLGMALLLRYRLRMTLSIAALLWLFLACLTAHAWVTGSTDDCGCYGSWLKSTPKQATLENLVFLAATLIAGWLSTAMPPSRAGKKTWAVAAAPVLGLVLPLLFGFSPSLTPRAGFEGNTLQAAAVQGLEGIDLARGSYLVVLLGTDCAHCKELLPEVDMLGEEPDIPRMVALSRDSEAQIDAFMRQYEPVFPVGQVSSKTFWRLLGAGKMPRILLVEDGRVRQSWDGEVPDQESIRQD